MSRKTTRWLAREDEADSATEKVATH